MAVKQSQNYPFRSEILFGKCEEILLRIAIDDNVEKFQLKMMTNIKLKNPSG